MIRLIIALAGLAVFGALFAGIYYAPTNLQFKEEGAPAFNLAPGTASQTSLQPTTAGSPLLIQIKTVGAIDVYVMEKAWSEFLPVGGRLLLDRAFTYDAAHSIIGLNGTIEFPIISDGLSTTLLVFDNSDNFYDGDATPDLNSTSGGQANIQITVRYLEEENRSLMLGYIAATPSILLVALTLIRKLRHGLN